MKTINIRSSDLAKLTGHNTYEPLDKVVKTILNDNKIKSCYVPKTNIEASLSELSPEKLKTIKQELKLSPKANIKDIESEIKKSVMKDSYSSNIKEETSKDNLKQNLEGKKTLQLLESSIQHDLQMKRGNIKESMNLNSIEKKRDMIITKRNSKLYSKELYRSPDESYCLILKGKVDGQSGDRIIETKNRTKRLFKVLREYEQVQLEAYMYLTGIYKATLTEHYNDESYEIDYEHNHEFWCDCLKNIIQFIDTHISVHIDAENEIM